MRSRRSAAAALEAVRTRHWSGASPSRWTRSTTTSMAVDVLPVPGAPRMRSTDPRVARWATAAACASSRLGPWVSRLGAFRNVSTGRFHHTGTTPPTRRLVQGAPDAPVPRLKSRGTGVQNRFCELRSQRADVLRLRALGALGDVELNLLVLVKRAVSAAGDGRVAREHVGTAVLGSNEAEALLSVEPLHGACCHIDRKSVV